MSTRVACDNALIGLKVRFPSSFNQISEPMLSKIGALNPCFHEAFGHARDSFTDRTLEFAHREAISRDMRESRPAQLTRRPGTPRSRRRALQELFQAGCPLDQSTSNACHEVGHPIFRSTKTECCFASSRPSSRVRPTSADRRPRLQPDALSWRESLCLARQWRRSHCLP